MRRSAGAASTGVSQGLTFPGTAARRVSVFPRMAGALNRAVKRNIERFPEDFMFQLSNEDWENLKCQIGISSSPTVPNKKKNGLIQSQILRDRKSVV